MRCSRSLEAKFVEGVERFVALRLPLRSREYAVGSPAQLSMVACIDALLAALVVSSSVRLFQVLAWMLFFLTKGPCQYCLPRKRDAPS